VVTRTGGLDILINNPALFELAPITDITRDSGVYCATKTAVISLTQSAGLNLIPHRINVNAIAPGR
jgi:D-sorbitol dehydrogenase (acceptor)